MNIGKTMDRMEAQVARPLTPFGVTPWYSEQDWLSRAAARLYWLPNVDIAVMGDKTVVLVELPGLTADDLELSILDNVLTIEGERKPDGAA